MNIAFFGSPQIASHLLTSLLEIDNTTVKLVITQPDKPAGKSLEMTPTPVKQIAIEAGISVFDRDLKKSGSLAELILLIKKYRIDVGILMAYGALLKDELLETIPQGIWNVHPSLLPLYRGPSPSAYPLILGDSKTGVTLIKLIKKLDAGPILAQEEYLIPESMNRTELEEVLTVKAIDLIKPILDKACSGNPIPTVLQIEAKSTYTRLLKKEDGYISSDLIKKAMNGETIGEADLPSIIQEYSKSYPQNIHMDAATLVYNMFRGMDTWPGIWTTVETPQGIKRVKILKVRIPDTKLVIDTVQIEGKRAVDFATFNKAYNF